MKKFSKTVALILVTLFSLLVVSCANKPSTTPTPSPKPVDKGVKNVILLIGDGMGKAHVKAGEIYKGSKLNMQGMPYVTTVETKSASAEITDSSAAATAMASGVRTNNVFVGIDPNENPLETIVDIAKRHNMSTGIVTSEELYGGTPMGFSAHSNNRRDYLPVLTSAATSSNVDLFIGETMEDEYVDIFTENGYTEIANVDDISSSTQSKIIGNYNIKAEAPSMSGESDSVALNRAVSEALDYLSKDEDGFFLMAEGAHIDHGGEEWDIEYVIRELMAFDDMVGTVLQWAKGKKDTVVLVTADHETGGLELLNTLTKDNIFDKTLGGNWVNVKFNVPGHSAEPVSCYYYGKGFSFKDYSSFGSADNITNTDIFNIMKDFITTNK